MTADWSPRRRHLPSIGYKPGWQFEWSCSNGYLFLHVTIGPPDAKAYDSRTGAIRTPSYSCTFICPQPFSPMWLLLLIGDLEEHERREWITLDGARTFDPHVVGEPGSAVANRPREWFRPTVMPLLGWVEPMSGKRYDWMYRVNWLGVGLLVTLAIAATTHELWVLLAYVVGVTADLIEVVLRRADERRKKAR